MSRRRVLIYLGIAVAMMVIYLSFKHLGIWPTMVIIMWILAIALARFAWLIYKMVRKGLDEVESLPTALVKVNGRELKFHYERLKRSRHETHYTSSVVDASIVYLTAQTTPEYKEELVSWVNRIKPTTPAVMTIEDHTIRLVVAMAGSILFEYEGVVINETEDFPLYGRVQIGRDHGKKKRSPQKKGEAESWQGLLPKTHPTQ